MEEKVFISMTLSEFQSVVIDCVTACLKANNPQPTIQITEKPLTVSEAAEFLRLQPATIYSLVNRKGIPYSKRGKRLYFSSKDLGDWARSGKLKELEVKMKYSPDTKLSDIESISVRSYNYLKANINKHPITLKDISMFGKDRFSRVRNVGPASVKEVESILKEAGLPF